MTPSAQPATASSQPGSAIPRLGHLFNFQSRLRHFGSLLFTRKSSLLADVSAAATRVLSECLVPPRFQTQGQRAKGRLVCRVDMRQSSDANCFLASVGAFCVRQDSGRGALSSLRRRRWLRTIPSIPSGRSQSFQVLCLRQTAAVEKNVSRSPKMSCTRVWLKKKTSTACSSFYR